MKFNKQLWGYLILITANDDLLNDKGKRIFREVEDGTFKVNHVLAQKVEKLLDNVVN